MEREKIGRITAGGLKEGLEVHLLTDPEEMREGAFVVVDGDRYRYFTIVTDIGIETTGSSFRNMPMDIYPPYVGEVLDGIATYSRATLLPTLMLDKPPEPTDDPAVWLNAAEVSESGPEPVKTVPRHASGVFRAGDLDFITVFGQESDTNFRIGSPRDNPGMPLCLNLSRFVKRSSGIFGSTGTGKSFLARILLSGLIQSGEAVSLVFDMHNEYAYEVRTEDGERVKGLRDIFPSHKIRICTLGQQTLAGHQPDFHLQIGLDEIQPEDILLLEDELNLTPTASEVAGRLYEMFGKDWLTELLSLRGDELDDFASQNNLHSAALGALNRRVRVFNRKGYLVESAPGQLVQDIVLSLQRGQHVFLAFGKYRDHLDYMLVSNILTRRIHDAWVNQMEKYYETRDSSNEPPPLVIALEEAHKFLNPRVAGQTIFGTIARELRKYNVTLMIIDQRPSGIYDEVMSQLGTRVTAHLTDANDISAVLTGVSGAQHLRSVLAALDQREQVLLMGFGVPMPVVVQVRRYDEQFYEDMGMRRDVDRQRQAERDIVDLFGEAEAD